MYLDTVDASTSSLERVSHPLSYELFDRSHQRINKGWLCLPQPGFQLLKFKAIKIEAEEDGGWMIGLG
eukprot:scaffold3457_cov111-Skeletonema_dohrnii-CCMP3373.AAC.2